MLATLLAVVFQHIHRIRANALPAPYATPSVNNQPHLTSRDGAHLYTESGYVITDWISGLERPRKLTVAPNGDVFVSESYAGRISVIRSGKSGPKRFTFDTGRKQPYGIAFYPPGPHPRWIYIADTDAVYRWPYSLGNLRQQGEAEKLVSLPGGGYHQHWTRNIIFSPEGTKMYITIGSASNASPEEPPRASIIQTDPDGKNSKIFASGLRNPVGLAWQPDTKELWAAVNERDMLGDQVPPDYATSVRESGFYGWPYYYIGDHHDPRLPHKPELGTKSIVPDVLLEAHAAALGIAFSKGASWGDNAYISMHGSWNRSVRSGYKVVRLPFSGTKPDGSYVDLAWGWCTADGRVWGRPVDVEFDPGLGLLVSDDGSGTIWLITRKK